MKLETKIKLKFYLLNIAFDLILMSFIGLIAWFSNKIIPTIIVFVSFQVLGFIPSKTFHFKKLLTCGMYSVLMYKISISLTASITISLFSGVITGYLMSWILFKIKDYCDLKQYKELHESFNLDTCTKEQVIERCKLLKYNAEQIDLAIKFYVEKLSNEKVWQYLCDTNRNVEIDTVRQYKYRIGKDLKKFIKVDKK